MTQNGVVTRLIGQGQAQVQVERGTACGGHCGGCEACVYAEKLLILAENAVYAQPGDHVILESSTGGIMGAAMLIYLMPLVFFFGAYAIGSVMGLNQGGCVAASVGGLILGGLLAVAIGRRRKQISFRIIGYSG